MSFRVFSAITLLLALIVVILGAYTRLVDAGLGCPDWPGCYGHYTVPQTTDALSKAADYFPGQIVDAKKAWPEMIHRYFAGTLGLCIFMMAILLWRRKQKYIAILLASLVVFQAALGMWTVTWLLLPSVVMGHLLGGLTLLGLLAWVFIRQFNIRLHPHFGMLRFLAGGGLLLVVLQIALGAWTSANYAAIICPDFPYCHGLLLPELDFNEAFNFFMPIGINYQGGLLPEVARQTIHLSHRYFAILVCFYLIILAGFTLFRAPRLWPFSLALLILLTMQVSFGIISAMYLPLSIAVLHNAFAALLLSCLVFFNGCLYPRVKLCK